MLEFTTKGAERSEIEARPSAQVTPFPAERVGRGRPSETREVQPEGLTAERLRELLDYDPETGIFTNRVKRGGKAKAGAIAGGVEGQGYVKIGIDGRRYLAHRLAFLFVLGAMPAGPLDHIDGDRANNRIDNLRLATTAQNGANRRPRSGGTSPFKGVSRFKRNGKWKAHIVVAGRYRHLGYHSTAEDAARAYDRAAVETFGTFALTNAMLGLLPALAA